MRVECLESIKKVRVRLTPRQNWTVDHEARSQSDMPTQANSSNAVCWCLTGALALETDLYGQALKQHNLWSEAYNALLDAARPRYGNLASFNDQEGHEAVLQLLDKVIAQNEPSSS